MSNLTLKSYLAWVKEYLASREKKIPQKISLTPYNRQQDFNYSKKLKSLGQNFTKTYPLHTITNEAREKKRFFRALYQNRIYNPDFHYKKKTTLELTKAKSIIELLDKFSQQVSPSTALGQIYQRRIFDAQKAILLTSLTQKEGFSWASRKYYNFKKLKELPPSSKISFPHNQQEVIGAYEIVYLAQKILSRIGLKHKARISAPSYRLQGLATTNHRLKIGRGTLRSLAHIIRSLAHEILGHALASSNAQKYPAYFARQNTSLTLLKEEGIAVQIGKLAYQNLKGFLPRSRRSRREDFIPLLRIKTILLARQKSFYETFRTLTKLNVNEDLAWEITTRVKRGVENTALPGANYHDSLYFLGLKKIENLTKRLPPEEMITLFNKLIQGKFDLVEFPFLKQHFSTYQKFNLCRALNIFLQEFRKIIKTRLITK